MFQTETETLPLNSALFLLPFLGAFELGMIVYSRDGISPVLSQMLFPGLFSIIFLAALLAQHLCYVPKQTTDIKYLSPARNGLWHQWKKSLWFGLIPALSIILVCIIATSFDVDTKSEVQFRLADHAMQSLAGSATIENQSTVKNIGHIIYLALNAGLIEEFLFRVVLLSGLFGLLFGMKISRRSSLPLSIILSSGLFALAHDASLFSEITRLHFDAIADQSLGLFFYRFCAGIYLATIYLHRGLGIAAGTHIVYDLTLGCTV